MKNSELIQTLNAHATRTPDEIVRSLANPFDNWRLGLHVTQDEIERFRDLNIVLLHHSYSQSPNLAEVIHRLGAWDYHRHWQDWLGQDYYVRSRESYDGNPRQVVDRNSEFCRR